MSRHDLERIARTVLVLCLATAGCSGSEQSVGVPGDVGDADTTTAPDTAADVDRDAPTADTPSGDATDVPDADLEPVDQHDQSDTFDSIDALDASDADLVEEPVLDLVRDDYVEATGEVRNPARGFYWWDWNDEASLVLVKVQLGAFCDGTPLPPARLDEIDARLAGHRAAGRSMILRVVYADGGELNACGLADASDVGVIEGHVSQLAPLLAEYAAETAYVEAGLLGMWGEWNSEHAPDGTSLVADAANRRRVLAALLAAVPVERQILVRRPRFRDEWSSGPDAFTAEELGRLGFHNDCFLASDTDYGTYDGDRSIEEWKDYIADATQSVGMGGETCRDEPMYTVCENALAELERLHFSYLHEGYHGDVIARWQDEGCFDEIARRLGYRLVVRSSAHTGSVSAGELLGLALEVENVGWAAVHRPLEVRLSLIDATGDTRVDLPITSTTGETDPRRWPPGAVAPARWTATVPAELAPGTWTLTLSLDDAMGAGPAYRVAFANDEVDPQTRALVVGTVEVR